MGKALNIKNEDVVQLAAEVARRTGTSMTEAVRDSLTRTLAHIKAEEDRAFDAWVEKLKANALPADFVLERDTTPPRSFEGWD